MALKSVLCVVIVDYRFVVILFRDNIKCSEIMALSLFLCLSLSLSLFLAN